MSHTTRGAGTQPKASQGRSARGRKGGVQHSVVASAFALVLLLSAFAPTPAPRAGMAAAAVTEVVIYGDGLTGGWHNWS